MKPASGYVARVGILILLAAAAGVALLILLRQRPGSEIAAPGETPAASREAAGEVAAPDAQLDESSAEAREAAARAAQRQRQAASTSLCGIVAGPAEALVTARVALLPAPPENLLMSLMGASSGQQLGGLQAFFEGRRQGPEQTLAADGRFEFLDPPPGRWDVELRHPLLRLATRPVVKVEKGKSHDLGVLASEPAGLVVAVVTDRNGRPVANADVTLSSDFDPMRFADPAALADFSGILRKIVPARGTTDEQGIHRFEGLPQAGVHRVEASAKGHAAASSEVEVIDGVQRIVRLVLGQAAKLQVTVRDAAGAGVSDARVSVLPAAPSGDETSKHVFIGDDHGERQRERTNAGGLAAFDSCRPGSATVEVEARGFLAWRRDVELAIGQTLELVAGLDRGASLAGRVVDDAGAPVASALVGELPAGMRQSVMGFEVSSFIPVVALMAMAKERGVQTGADGRFELGGLEPAPKKGDGIWLIVVAEGHAPGKPGPFAPGADDLVLRLERLGGVRGRVLGADGKPQAEFEAWVARTQMLVFEGHDGQLARGAEPGSFVLTGLQRGKQTLVVEAPGHNAWRGSVEIAAEPTDVGDIQLVLPSAITGVTVDDKGVPVAGVAVRVSRGGMADFESMARMRGQEIATSDAEGRFRLAKVPERRVRLVAEKEGYAPARTPIVRVDAGQVAEVRIELGRGGSVRGRVVDAGGKPMAGWVVQITSNALAVQRTKPSDAEGAVVFDGLADGAYQVVAFPQDWIQSLQRRVMRKTRRTSNELGEMEGMGEAMSTAFQDMLRTQVTVKSGSEATFELVAGAAAVVEATAKVEGRVRVAGQPLASGFVELLELGGGQRLLLAQVKDGSYELPRVAPGSYRSRVRAGIFGGASPRGDVVRVPAQAVYRLDLELPGGRLAGRVVDRQGKPVKQAMVKLRGEDERSHPSPFQVEDMAGDGLSLSDEQGRFRFEGLPAGSYDVVARALSFVTGSGGGGVLRGVTLAHGEQRDDLEVMLRDGGRIRVRVTANGAPRPGVLVRVMDAEGRPEVMHEPVATDKDGEATLMGLSAGRYRILADADGLAPTLSEPVAVDDGGESEVSLAVVSGVEVRLAVAGDRVALPATEFVAFAVWDAQGRLMRAGAVPAATLRAPAAAGGVRVATLRPGRYRARIESASLGVVEGEQEVPAAGPIILDIDLAKRTVVRR